MDLDLKPMRVPAMGIALVSAVSFVSCSVFTFAILASGTSTVADALPGAAQTLARLAAKDAAVRNAGTAFLFLAVLGIVQLALTVLALKWAARSSLKELSRRKAAILERDRKIGELAALSGWREVASFLSHQLKNPLAAADLAARNAKECSVRDDPTLKEMLAENLDILLGETERMRALVMRLKQLTAFDEPEFKNVTLDTVLGEAKAKYDPHKVLFSVEGDADTAILADRQLLAQAFINLFDNSVEAATQDDPDARAAIRVAVTSADGMILATVSDSNVVTDKSIAERIGRMRFTTKQTGSGLGLGLVAKIAAVHGGSFSACVREGAGVQVTLGIPLAGKKAAIS